MTTQDATFANTVSMRWVAFVALLFVCSLFFMPTLQPLFVWAFPDITPAVYARSSFWNLWLAHAGIVLVSSAIASAIGVLVAIGVTRSRGAEFRPLVTTIASIGQTFPPVAVLAIAVPVIGFGAWPILIALVLYGWLPIVANAIAGLQAMPAAVREAAHGMGLSPRQVLWQVELPLAAPMILAGIRTSVIVNIGTATLGSTVGVLTLGTPIINGMIAQKIPYVIQGTIVVGLFAILTDLLFERLEARLRYR